MNLQTLKGPDSDNQYQNIVFHDKGGMGEIYSAIDTINNNKVGIKIIYILDPTEIKLLRAETDIALQLNHPNIIRTFYAGEGSVSGKSFFYSVMEFAECGNLKGLLERSKENITVQDAINYIINIATGLEYAHKVIIHRDLKPLNILISSKGRLMICDFGLARYVDAQTRSHTFKGAGSRFYMAPECWTLSKNSIAMDIYSLGIIFFEILTKRVPFTGNTVDELKEKHLFETLPKIMVNRQDVPIKLIEIIEKMTSKKASDRYKNMSEVIEAIKSITSHVEASLQSDPILIAANKASSEQTKRNLEGEKRSREGADRNKHRIHIQNTLIQQYKNRIDELNNSLQQNKIIVSQFNNTGVSFSYLQKRATITFFPQYVSEIVAAEQRKNRSNHSMFNVYDPALYKSHLEKDNIRFVGIVQIGTTRNSKDWGYNILWRQNDEADIYGEWWVVWFDDGFTVSVLGAKKHYGLDENYLWKEYEYGRGKVMHTINMTLRVHSINDINDLLKELVTQ